MPERMRMLDEPGPFVRIAQSIDDRMLLSEMIFEQAVAVSGGLAGRLEVGAMGHMTDAEILTAALRLATSTLAAMAELGISAPLKAVGKFGAEAADRAEREAAAA